MPYIQSGSYNAKTKKIEINVRYSGGCAKHKFRLKVDTCRESYPVQCDATLIDLTTGDFCKALIHRKISISLHEAGLDNNYYKGASIRIRGAEQKLGDSAYIIRGTDREKPAWHYILVPLSKLADIKAQGTGADINVTDFGCIIAYLDNSGNIQKTSDWGFDPPEMVQALIETNYDLASVDETISLNYEEDDIRLCTMQRAIPEQKLGFFSCYHRKERFHYVKFYGDWKSSLAYRAGIKNFDRIIALNDTNIEKDTPYQVDKRFNTNRHLPVQMLVCSPATYIHYRSTGKLLQSDLSTVQHLKPIYAISTSNSNTDTSGISIYHESFCAVQWENSKIVSTVPQSAIFKAPEFTSVNDICFIETEAHYQKGRIIFKGSRNDCEKLSTNSVKLVIDSPRDRSAGFVDDKSISSLDENTRLSSQKSSRNPNERTVAVDSTYMNDENRTILKLQLSLLGLTDDLHPFPIDHDYTLQTNVGHSVFYNPKNIRSFGTAEIRTRTLLQLSTDRPKCFRIIWGIINLPIDNYSFLFRVNSPKNVQRSFALDNIAINLCDDPPTELTMCDMINKHDDSSSMFNFTVVTGNREFGSTRDHTSTSSSGSFLY
ncbi:unnamed protein product [Rotaria sp. Silwood1]|nr:unnamed protein product [Rotaria sp. Silwood1]